MDLSTKFREEIRSRNLHEESQMMCVCPCVGASGHLNTPNKNTCVAGLPVPIAPVARASSLEPGGVFQQLILGFFWQSDVGGCHGLASLCL